MCEGEIKILQTVIRLRKIMRVSFHGSEAAEKILFSVKNDSHSQSESENESVRVTVISGVTLLCSQTIVAAPPQKRKLLFWEFCEDVRNVENDPQIERQNGEKGETGKMQKMKMIKEADDSEME
jgi:hypothetical protein